MDKSDLEDGEVPSSDVDDEPMPEPVNRPAPPDADAKSPPASPSAAGSSSAEPAVAQTANATPNAKKIGTIKSVDEILAAASAADKAKKQSDKTKRDNDTEKTDGEDGPSRQSEKRRLRKMRRQQEESEKKAKKDAQIKQLEAAEMDEYEMLCVRGASPPRRPTLSDPFEVPTGKAAKRRRYSDDDDDLESDYYQRQSAGERRETRRKRTTRGGRNRRRNLIGDTSDDQGSGADERNNGPAASSAGNNDRDAKFSRYNEMRQPRKLELCKFFLTGKCAKQKHCTYLHEEFPCKFYYLGIPHNDEECMFSHGPPLDPSWQSALLKHIERAPTQILGKFPKAYRTNAARMMRTTHERLVASLKSDGSAAPDAFTNDQNGQRKNRTKHANDEQLIASADPDGWQPAGIGPAKSDPDGASKMPAADVSANNWHQDGDQPTPIDDDGAGRAFAPPANNATAASDWPSAQASAPISRNPFSRAPAPDQLQQQQRVPPRRAILETPIYGAPPAPLPGMPLQPQVQQPPAVALPAAQPAALPFGGGRIDFMADILNAEQLSRLRMRGIEYLSQVNDLTVSQLNEIGMSIAQIHQIQMCALNTSNPSPPTVASTNVTVAPLPAVPVSVTAAQPPAFAVPASASAMPGMPATTLHHHQPMQPSPLVTLHQYQSMAKQQAQMPPIIGPTGAIRPPLGATGGLGISNGDVDMRIPAMAVANSLVVPQPSPAPVTMAHAIPPTNAYTMGMALGKQMLHERAPSSDDSDSDDQLVINDEEASSTAGEDSA